MQKINYFGYIMYLDKIEFFDYIKWKFKTTN